MCLSLKPEVTGSDVSVAHCQGTAGEKRWGTGKTIGDLMLF